MKDKYFRELLLSNGSCNEIELGEQLGLDENATRTILVQLLAEYKIEHKYNGNCEYRAIKAGRAKPKRNSSHRM